MKKKTRISSQFLSSGSPYTVMLCFYCANNVLFKGFSFKVVISKIVLKVSVWANKCGCTFTPHPCVSTNIKPVSIRVQQLTSSASHFDSFCIFEENMNASFINVVANLHV